jgi:hypothetical protein
MKGVRDRRFLPAWRALYDSSNPGRTKDRWVVDGVEWTRARHSLFGAEHSFQLEIHSLVHPGSGARGWSLLVVVEHWWGAARSKELRLGEWCRLTAGRSEDAVGWLERQARKEERGARRH